MNSAPGVFVELTTSQNSGSTAYSSITVIRMLRSSECRLRAPWLATPPCCQPRRRAPGRLARRSRWRRSLRRLRRSGRSRTRPSRSLMPPSCFRTTARRRPMIIGQDAHDDRDGGRVVVLLARERQVVGVHVGREVGRDGVGCEPVQDVGLVEQLQAADDREDQRDHERRPQRGQLDPADDPNWARPVDLRRLVQVSRHRPQRGVEDQHVVADELPGDDVADGRQHPAAPKRVGKADAQHAASRATRPNCDAVHEAPHRATRRPPGRRTAGRSTAGTATPSAAGRCPARARRAARAPA